MKKIRKTIFALTMAAALLVSEMPSFVMTAQAHGTTDAEITKGMLKETPPADYKVNMDMQKDASEGAYNAYFLDDDIQTVSIDVDEKNLNYLFQNAEEKPTVMTNSVTIGDQTIGYTGLKTKGNYTLAHTSSDNINSDRFSFTINFGKYIKKKEYGVKQNFYGCSKISFNNFYFDKSMMKEFFAMKLMSEMGLPTPQYGLAKLYINDKYYGVYFMVEAMDSTILEQYKKVSSKEISSYLTKPEDTTLAYDEGLDSLLTKDGTFDLSSVLSQDAKGNYKASGILEEQKALWEDDPDTLQDVADMLPTVLGWEKKLNQLSNGTDFSGKSIDVNSKEYLKLLEEVMDVDEVVRYFAVHSFLVQLDYMFTELQNFGLYVDENGKSMIVPWDYDLCFGCYYPSEAEKTANFSIDVMYKSGGFGGWGDKQSRTPFSYKDFPLFYVIYQNKELMEKYHNYMKECSKVAALGGTVSAGGTYEPGWFHSYIERFEEKLEKAASEELADNVYYVNNANQPQDMKRALPNLSEIIAMRSVGVLVQVDQLDTTVCGYGCDLSTLGNAIQGRDSTMGNLTIVDEKTGIFASAGYGGGNLGKKPPSLSVRKLGANEEIFQTVKQAVDCTDDASLTVYTMSDTAKPNTEYTLHIPVGTDYAKGDVTIYSYTSDTVKKLDVTADDNIYSGTTDSIQYIAVVKGNSSIWSNPLLLIVLALILIAVIVVAVIMMRKKKVKRDTPESRS